MNFQRKGGEGKEHREPKEILKEIEQGNKSLKDSFDKIREYL